MTDALVSNYCCYEDIEIVHLVPLGKSEYCKKGMEKHFRHNSLFVGPTTRQAISEGRGDFTPAFLHEIPNLIRTKLAPDVALLHLSKPNKLGYCSFGISVDYSKPAAHCSKMNIAQINSNMPFTFGDSMIHISMLDYIVESDTPLLELTPPSIGDTERAIGENVAQLINDGDTLQLGIGAIPDAVLKSLKTKNDLGLYTEMFSDGVIDLIETGVITNAKKNIHQGKSVASFMMGSRRLYDYVDNNPNIEMYPVDYVNNPRIASQNDNLISVNSCIQVDLLGQVVSDSVGLLQISGVGGQVHFVRSAAMSKGGKSIIAFASTAKGGTVSKIVSFIDKGSAVTTSRNDVEYIVTEYGIANLKGSSLRQRAYDLIQIAHPDFREDLKKEYNKRFEKR